MGVTKKLIVPFSCAKATLLIISCAIHSFCASLFKSLVAFAKATDSKSHQFILESLLCKIPSIC